MDVLNHLMAQLAGLEDAQRLYRLEASFLPGAVVMRWQGRDGLGEHAVTEVDVLSTRADLALGEMLGQRALLHTRLPSGETALRGGLVAGARRVGSDGGLARYRLELQSWTWWLQHGRHSRVFQEQSVRQIVDAVLGEYAQIACWRWAEGCDAFLEGRVRSYCVQYRESDLAFVQRLLTEEGLSWRTLADAEAPCGNVMEVFADSRRLPQADANRAGVRFHRADATEKADSVLSLGHRRRLSSTRVTLRSDDYRSVQNLTAQQTVDGGGRLSAREAFDSPGAYAFSGWNAAQHYATLHAEALEAQAQVWWGHGTVRGLRSGTWFTLQDAPRHDLPNLLLVQVEHKGINNLPVDVRKQLDATLPIGIQRTSAVDPLPIAPNEADLWAQAEQTGYAQRWIAAPHDKPWRSVLPDGTGTRLNPRATAPGYQTAIVVGGSAEGGQDLHCDALGRIKVRFHFQDGDGHHDSAWLRVMQRYAGPGVGSQFLPRIGQEVLVGFLEDEIDRPIVLGALYNGLGEAGVPRTPGGNAGQSDLSIYAQAQDHRPSAQANLGGGQAPVWHGWGPGEDQHRNPAAQWGIRSQEWGGSGYSQLVFDDSNGQLRTQLATTQAATQLNLGHLIHSADNYRGSFRGEGFELRTDAWGSVRCERGLWLSAYTHNPNEPAGLAVQQVALLNQLNALGKTFSQAAKTHLTSPLAAHEGIKKPSTSQLSETQAPLAILHKSTGTTVTGTDVGDAYADAPQREASAGSTRVPHTGDPILGISAPAGVMHVAGQALHWNAGETLTLASGQDSDAAVMHRARLHSGQAIGVLAAASKGQREDTSLSIVAGEGELDIQAQHDQVKLQAKDHLHVASRSAEVELAAGKTIHIATAGGASITIENGNITFNVPGEIKVQAQRKSFVGATQLSREMNNWPDGKFNEGFRAVFPDGEPAKNYRYQLTRADGAIISGTTDENGVVPMQQGMSLEQVLIEILGPANEGVQQG